MYILDPGMPARKKTACPPDLLIPVNRRGAGGCAGGKKGVEARSQDGRDARRRSGPDAVMR